MPGFRRNGRVKHFSVMIRLFTAIEIPEMLESGLTALQSFADGRWDPNWVGPETFHITLVYIGEVEEPQAEDIDGELRHIRAGGFELELQGVGAFGGTKPHILYAAVAKSKALEHLRDKQLSALRRAGVEIEGGRYVPHVTLARPRHPPLEMVQAWEAANNLYRSGPFPVERSVLFSSHKMGSGRHYEPEREYPLGPALI